MIVKAATIDLVTQLLDLGPTIFANGARCFGGFDANAWMAELWRLLNLKDRAMFVAMNDATIVGAHIVMLAPAFALPSAVTARVLTLWVNPHVRGKQLATMLNASAEGWARKAGATRMLAGVPVDYDAHRMLGDDGVHAGAAEAFYQKRGYARLETQFIKELV